MMAAAISMFQPSAALACVGSLPPRLEDASRSVFIGTLIAERKVDETTTAFTVRVTEHVTGVRLKTVIVYAELCGFYFIIGDQAVFALGNIGHPTRENSAAFRFFHGQISDGILADVPRVRTVRELLLIFRARLPDTSIASTPDHTSGESRLLLGSIVLVGIAGSFVFTNRRHIMTTQRRLTSRAILESGPTTVDRFLRTSERLS